MPLSQPENLVIRVQGLCVGECHSRCRAHHLRLCHIERDHRGDGSRIRSESRGRSTVDGHLLVRRESSGHCGHANPRLNRSDKFAFGALPVAPLSESFGRQPIYLVTLLVSSAFTIGTGAAQTWAQVLVCRFFAGATGGKRGFSYHAIDLMADRFTRDDEKSRCSGCCWRIAE